MIQNIGHKVRSLHHILSSLRVHCERVVKAILHYRGVEAVRALGFTCAGPNTGYDDFLFFTFFLNFNFNLKVFGLGNKYVRLNVLRFPTSC